MAKVVYSATLAEGGDAVVFGCENILERINKMRTQLETALVPDNNWRNYPEEILAVFENMASLERETLYLIENMDMIRRKNDDLIGG